MKLLFMMDVVTSGLIAVSHIEVSSESTPVSGPHGLLTRRYAAATPCRDHSDASVTLSAGYGPTGDGLVKSIDNDTGFAAHRHQQDMSQPLATFMHFAHSVVFNHLMYGI